MTTCRKNFSAQSEESGIEPSAIGESSLTLGTVATHGRTDLEPGYGGAAGLLLILALRISNCCTGFRPGLFIFAPHGAAMKQKCKAGRTTDLPSRRHVVGIRRWFGQCIRLPRPQRYRKKTKARHLGLDTLEGVLGPSFFPQRKRDPRNEAAKKPSRGR